MSLKHKSSAPAILAVLIAFSLFLMVPALAAQNPSMKATLVNAEANAKDKSATVEVDVTGASLTDPAKANKIPKAGQVHLHYQIDGGPVIATTASKLSFHGLTSGKHTIVVQLAANDHSPIGSPTTLEVTVP